MVAQLDKNKTNQWVALKQWIWQGRKIWITASSVTSCVLLIRFIGLLQYWEWAALDEYFRLRPLEPIDERVVVVAIDDDYISELKNWPLSDALIAELLQKLQGYQPRAIGLDIYRHFPIEPGYTELQAVMQSIPNLIGIERIQDDTWPGIPAPPILNERKQVGFNNVLVDLDGKMRRNVLYWWPPDGKTHKSFAFQLALLYLKAEGIQLESTDNPKHLKLGKAILRPLDPYDGGYVRVDTRGYQIISNFRGPADHFQLVSIADVLSDRVSADFFRDRIVLIGSTAIRLKDYFLTPYSGGLVNPGEQTSAVEIHANFISELLNAAMQGRPLLRVWSEPVESLWIFAWSCLGAIVCWKFRSPLRSSFGIILAGTSLMAGTYVLFVQGWWIPVVPPLLGLLGSAATITSYLAHLEEELKRSKEFLHQVIDTIPDPIFVKNQDHQWIVLNQAFCSFIKRPFPELIDQSEFKFFPEDEAEVFWQQDEWVFTHHEASEHEEKFTDARGAIHLISTKRSLHKDVAGNLFLVGVIRDITERKRMEEELKRTASELARSNAELKVSEDRLRYLAYHDPLTGLPNRKMFYERLNQTLDWASSNQQWMALLFLDLDGFKEINDTLGHDSGDVLLKAVAVRLTKSLRGSDTVCRLGGDEFTVILPAIPRQQDVARVSEKILTALSQPFDVQGNTLSVTTSIGISLYPLNGDAADSLIKQADAAMYRAKELGKNRYEFS